MLNCSANNSFSEFDSARLAQFSSDRNHLFSPDAKLIQQAFKKNVQLCATKQ